MTKTRNLSDLLDNNGDVKLANLDNVPASNDASALTTGTLPIARIADGDITLNKLSATGTKDATTFLRGDNTFATPAGGTNTPAFQAFMNGNQTIPTGSYTKLEMDAEVFDTDSKYDTSTYRFTPTVAGQYWVWGKFRFDDGVDIGSAIMAFFKNGTIFSKSTEFTTDVTTLMFGMTVELDSDDYLEIYAYQSSVGSVSVNGNATYPEQDVGTWGAYRIIE